MGQEPDALLFTSRSGRALHYNAWRTWHFDKAVTAAGLQDVTPHDLRATHATWVADRHGVMAAAKRLGHSNASVTTRHYARVVDGRDADVARTMHDEHGRTRAKGTANDHARNGHGDDDDGPAGVPVPV
ncbi:tyrosine-type recombinase/integrase [Streptomyces sp. NPDC051776]|uniref:tyrosine-type recombinase/integrase n=1 Tax=Streptomyces sp. NPDC051776 TaxID=3155414 RepID=UPI00341ACC24